MLLCSDNDFGFLNFEFQKMKIAFDHQVFTNQKYGGISRYFLELAENISYISKNETDIKIFAPIYKNNYLYSSAGKFRAAGLKFPDLPKTGRILRLVNNFASHYQIINFNPDIIPRNLLF